MDRAAAKLIVLVTAEHGRFKSKVAFDRAVDIAEFAAVRTARAKTSENRAGKFERGVGYRYSKSLFTQDWFDSGPERDVANLLDGAAEVAHWLRLQRNDLPIVWAEHREYNPDFVVVESDGDHFVLEVKMQKEMASADVQAKREAARRWANYVNASSKVQSTWSYLLAGEADVKTAAGSWPALKRLAS
jgi:type III restriction enzyme